MDELLYGMELLHSVNVNEKGENEKADDYENGSNSTSTKDNDGSVVMMLKTKPVSLLKVKQKTESNVNNR